MTAERIMHTHARAITVRHVEAQPASGPHRPAMPEHYVTELDGQPLCWIPASALAPLLAEAEARGARSALREVAALHPRGETSYPPGEGYVSDPEDYIEDGCQACREPWPCPTAAAVARAEDARLAAARGWDCSCRCSHLYEAECSDKCIPQAGGDRG